MDLKGVLLDFGDTLAHIDEARDQQYTAGLLSILREYGYQQHLDDLTSLLDKAYYESSKGELNTSDVFWQGLLKDLGIRSGPALVAKLEAFRKRNYATVFELYDGAIPVLVNLRRRYKLALVSNCAIGLSDIIKALGLRSFFETIILSYEIGVRKPAERIYSEALQRLQLEPRECVFVSDEISDLEGASAVGLRTFLVRQGPHTTHEAKDANFKPDFQCNCISEVTDLL